MRPPLSLALLAGLLLVPVRAFPGADRDEALEAQIRVLQDVTRPDDQRAAVRTQLVTLVARGEQAVIERILKLGRETTNDSVRFQVGYVLAQTRLGKSIVPAAYTRAVVELLATWFEPDDGNASVRLWAAVGLATSHDERVLPLLTEKALAPSCDPVIRAAVARALGGWRGPREAHRAAPRGVPEGQGSRDANHGL